MRRPFQSLTRLDRALWPGQTGCLLAGTYGGLHAWHLLGNSGTQSRRITIRSAPGVTAQIDGWVDLQGSYTTLERVRIDGSNTLYVSHPSGVNCRGGVSQPLSISGSHDVLQYVNYYQSVPALRGVGVGIGFSGDSRDDVIRHDRIHDVGGCAFYDHLIYLARGYGAQIYDNWLWNDAHGWGIKLDPGPTGARIWGNVIDRAGSGFNFGNSSGGLTANNQVFDNIVMNSVGVSNPDIQWGHPGVLVTSAGLLDSSSGNRVFDNDSFHNPGGLRNVVDSVTKQQLDVSHNISIRPQFVNASAHNYALLGGQARLLRAFARRG